METCFGEGGHNCWLRFKHLVCPLNFYLLLILPKHQNIISIKNLKHNIKVLVRKILQLMNIYNPVNFTPAVSLFMNSDC